MTTYFQFEQDFVESLRCIPMSVRLKLDTCGIKLKLPQWFQFTSEERQELVNLNCNEPGEIQVYQSMLKNLILERTGVPATEIEIAALPAWMNVSEVPDSVCEKARSLGTTISLQQWHALTSVQRFALIKLSLSSHENKNFLPAMREFGLSTATAESV